MIQKYAYYELSVKDSLFIWLFIIEKKKAYMRTKFEFVFMHMCTQISVIYVYIHSGSCLHIYIYMHLYIYVYSVAFAHPGIYTPFESQSALQVI